MWKLKRVDKCVIFLCLRQLLLRHYFLYRTIMSDFYACLR
ncbi:phage DNA binding protein [Escherichia coli PA9]|nr:phage DNA binding protein [Escherichia coli 93-001]EIN67295.1 phage DNA binding protein [Escherichia coli PA9]EIO25619.1 phage DNA binding protein [Escherichia coli PA33]EIP74294.1 phage DNA binding protein [Escherichia coli EC4448]EKH48303.1 phage DNA binding protein [Escherichia coli FRIK1997]EKH60746.1 phage DNA binding protein [Escherichia coli NE037]EKI98944.1 phage DNA binding protein [Escherichia coli EC1849]EKJ19081.1 phage DNA binding protein [Escherichia coli EC1864]EKJ35183.1 